MYIYIHIYIYIYIYIYVPPKKTVTHQLLIRLHMKERPDTTKTKNDICINSCESEIFKSKVQLYLPTRIIPCNTLSPPYFGSSYLSFLSAVHPTLPSDDVAIHCNTLQPITTRCNTLQHTEDNPQYIPHCLPITLQYTIILCNPLQHAATHCNTPKTIRRTSRTAF